MEHVTFDVTRGSVFGILGGSGSGKSSERIGNTQEQPKAALPLVSEVRAQKVEVGEAREMRGKLIIDTVTQHPGKTQCLTR